MGCSSEYVESDPLLSALVSVVAVVYSYPYLSSPPLSFLSVSSFSLLVLPLFPVKWYKKGQNLTFFAVIFISNPPRLCLGTHQWCRALSSHPQNSMPQSQPNAARLFVKERYYRYDAVLKKREKHIFILKYSLCTCLIQQFLCKL